MEEHSDDPSTGTMVTPEIDPLPFTSEEKIESKPSNSQEIFKALEFVERDSFAIAESYSSLFSSLRLALSEATGNTVEHMHCFSDAAGRLQESVLDASTRGNRYINSCLRLNEEMKGIDDLAKQLKHLRRNVDVLDSAVNKLLRLPLFFVCRMNNLCISVSFQKMDFLRAAGSAEKLRSLSNKFGSILSTSS